MIGVQFPLPFVSPEGADYDDTLYRLPEIEKRDGDGNAIPPVLVACSCCDEEHEEDKLTPHSQNDEERLCEDCACSCEECGDVYSSDDDELRTAYDGDEYGRNRNAQRRCDNCCWKCADCGDYHYGEDSRTNASDERICTRCSENYYTCESCNATIHQDNTHSIPLVDEDGEETGDYEDGSYCESCYRESMSERRREREQRESGDDEETETPRRSSRSAPVPAPAPRVHELVKAYDYKPRPRFAHAAGEENAISPLDYYGIELETQLADSKAEREHDNAIRSSGIDADHQFYVKRDGSLLDGGDGGFEIVSHPATLRYWLEHELAFCGKLPALGYESEHADCGLHIHVSRSALSRPQIAKLMLFIKANPEFMRRVSRRIGSEDHYYKLDLRSTRELIGKAACNNSHAERYTAVNLENENTVEFRLFQGTLDTTQIKLNLCFVACLCAFLRSAPLSRLTAGDYRSFLTLNARKLIGREHARKLIAWIDDNPHTLAA
jgi:hypothetical protein